VARKREARIALAELEAQARAEMRTDVTPAELLLDAAQTTGAVVAKLKMGMSGRGPDPTQMDALGAWLDRLQRTAQAVISSKADELLIRQAEQVSRAQAGVMVSAVRAALAVLDLTPEQRRQVPAAVEAALASVESQTLEGVAI